MKLLLDTHLLLWAAGEPQRLPQDAQRLLAVESNQLIFSVASLWEISIKSALGRADFKIDNGAILALQYPSLLQVETSHTFTVSSRSQENDHSPDSLHPKNRTGSSENP